MRARQSWSPSRPVPTDTQTDDRPTPPSVRPPGAGLDLNQLRLAPVDHPSLPLANRLRPARQDPPFPRLGPRLPWPMVERPGWRGLWWTGHSRAAQTRPCSPAPWASIFSVAQGQVPPDFRFSLRLPARTGSRPRWSRLARRLPRSWRNLPSRLPHLLGRLRSPRWTAGSIPGWDPQCRYPRDLPHRPPRAANPTPRRSSQVFGNWWRDCGPKSPGESRVRGPLRNPSVHRARRAVRSWLAGQGPL